MEVCSWQVGGSNGGGGSADGQGGIGVDRAVMLNWPHGGTLWFIDMFGALITLPINWISGPVAAYNASMVNVFVRTTKVLSHIHVHI